MQTRSIRRTLGLTTAGLLLAAAHLSTARAEETTVQMTVTSSSAVFWVNWLAETGTFYKDEGLVSEIVMVTDVAQQVQQVIAGATDIAYTTCEAAVRGIDKGAPVSIIGVTMQRYPYSVWGKDVANAADLTGKTVMMSGVSDVMGVVFNRWLTEQGVKPSDVDLRFDVATSNRFAGLMSGAASAAMLTPPFDFRAEGEGMTMVFDFAPYLGDYPLVCAIARKDWLAANGDTATAQLRVVRNATAFFYDPANRDAVVQRLMEMTKSEQPLAERTYDYYFDTLVTPFVKDLSAPEGGLQKMIDALLVDNQIQPGSKAEQFLDMSFLPK